MTKYFITEFPGSGVACAIGQFPAKKNIPTNMRSLTRGYFQTLTCMALYWHNFHLTPKIYLARGNIDSIQPVSPCTEYDRCGCIFDK